MQKVISTIGMLVLPILLLASTPDREAIRKEFMKCVEDKERRQQFLEELESNPTKDATMMAYFGAAKAMMAECVMSPISKYTFFTDGTEMIEDAIDEEPTNLELRYLRFLIQSNSPSFLGYNENIDEDFKVLSSAVASGKADGSWKESFIAFLQRSGQNTQSITQP